MQEMQEIRRNGNANRSKYRMDSSAAGIDPELLAPRSTTPLNSFFPHFPPNHSIASPICHNAEPE